VASLKWLVIYAAAKIRELTELNISKDEKEGIFSRLLIKRCKGTAVNLDNLGVIKLC